ncbi:hypothetical protein ACF0H5_002497 [Mactra antiquata]
MGGSRFSMGVNVEDKNEKEPTEKIDSLNGNGKNTSVLLSSDEEDENFLNFVLKASTDLDPILEDDKSLTNHEDSSTDKDITDIEASLSHCNPHHTVVEDLNTNTMVTTNLPVHLKVESTNASNDNQFNELSAVSNSGGTSGDSQLLENTASDMGMNADEVADSNNDFNSANDLNNNNAIVDAEGDKQSYKDNLLRCSSTTNSCQGCETDSERISPELFCLSHMSPSDLYGKDQSMEYQRLYTRSNLFSSRSSSTLNTPDPILFDDASTDFYGTYRFSRHDANGNVSTISQMDHNNNNDANDQNNDGRGTKRKYIDSNMDLAPVSQCPISEAAISSIINQGRPPDISTWRAVSSSHDPTATSQDEYQNSHLIKPQCIVTPFQSAQPPPRSIYSNNFGSAAPQQELPFTSSAVGSFNTANSYSTMPQQQYLTANPYDGFNGMNAANQLTLNAANYNNYQGNYGFRHQPAYRLDFSSPNMVDTQGIVNFVSYPPHDAMDLARPRAMHPNNYISNYNMSNSMNTVYPLYDNHRTVDPMMNSTVSVPYPANELQETNNTHLLTPNPGMSQCFKPVNHLANTECMGSNAETASVTHDLIGEQTKDTDDIDINNNCVPTNSCNNESYMSCSNNYFVEPVDRDESTKSTDLFDEKREEEGRITDPSEFINHVEEGTTVEDSVNNNNDINEDQYEQPDDEVDKLSESSSTSAAAPEKYAKVQNKYFTEIFLKTRSTNSPVTSFCKALDLSKKIEKKANETPKEKTILPKGLPYGEPPIPVSYVLNAMPGPMLTYNHGMLVPYMNSIFAAMENFKSLPPQSSFGAILDPALNAHQGASVLTGQRDPILNQHSAMYSSNNNYSTRLIAPKPNTANVMPGNALFTAVPVNTLSDPKVNFSQYPLPLYPYTTQYPVRPLMNNSFSITPDGQRIQTPYLYRYNIGLPAQTIPTQPNYELTATPVVSLHGNWVNNNNNNVQNTGGSDKSQCSIVNNGHTSAGHSTGLNCVPPQTRSSSTVTCSMSTPAPSPISIDQGHNMTVQGKDYTFPVPHKKKGLTVYQPTPLRGVYCDKQRTFKAKHFAFCNLQIGSYKYQCPSSSSEKVARVKVLFSKRRFVYEYQLDGPSNTMKSCDDMVCIEVPFNTIIGLWLFRKDMRLEVNQAPKIFLGKKSATRKTSYFATLPVYSNKVSVDITNGQLGSYPYHYVQFKQLYAEKLMTELRQFDVQFETLLGLPLVEDQAKSLKPSFRQIQSRILDSSVQLPDENMNYERVYIPDEQHVITESVYCSCTTGCSTRSCQCCKNGTTCTEGLCSCDNCHNPLNILYQLGLPTDRARTDPCLMENIFKIRRLDYYLKTQVTLECCQLQVLLFNCIPGLVQCPYCPAQYKYSWCYAQACHQQSKPRNHCIKCGKCTDHRNTHCKKCKLCYFAGEDGSLECSRCKKRKKSKISDKRHRKSYSVKSDHLGPKTRNSIRKEDGTLKSDVDEGTQQETFHDLETVDDNNNTESVQDDNVENNDDNTKDFADVNLAAVNDEIL